MDHAVVPLKVWLALFLVALAVGLYKGLRDPIWCAMGAAYLYFAIPDREFNAGQLPYQVTFWALGVLMAALLYRGYFRTTARRELEEAALGSVRAAIDGVRSDLKTAILDASMLAVLPGDVRSAAMRAVEEKALDLVDRTAPRPIGRAMRRAAQAILTAACDQGEAEALKVRDHARGATKGNVRAALEARVPPIVDEALDKAVASSVTSRLEEEIDVHAKRTAREGGPSTASLGPLGIPLYRGPLLGVLSNPGLMMFIAFMVLTYIGAENAEFDSNKAMAKFDLEQLLLIPMIAIICCVRDPRHVRLFCAAWCAGVVHLCLNAITYWFHNGGRADDVGGQGGESNFLGAIIMTVCPIAYGMMLNEKTRFWRLVGIGLVGIFVLGVLASGSRAALIALLGSGGYWLFHTNRKGVAVGLAVIGVAGFLAVAPDSFWDRMGTIVGPKDQNPWVKLEEEPSKHEREVLWELAIDIWKSHPLMGIGPGQYNFVSAEQTEFVDAYQGVRGLQTHNTWLQMAAEYGALGTAVWGGAFFLSMFCYGLARKRIGKYKGWEWFASMCLGLEAGSLGSAIACTFNSFQWYDYHYWHFVLGPVVYQIAKETSERLEWMKPIETSEPRPPPRYGPPEEDVAVEDIDLSNAAPVAPESGPATVTS
jgi:O-antigen ligase